MTPPRPKQWPFDGDAPVTRARKVSGAYRATAVAYEESLTAIGDALQLIDLRLINFDQPGAADIITKAIAAAGETQSVAQLDQRFTDWGEAWHCPRPTTYSEDDLVDAIVAAEILQIASGTVHKFRTNRRIKAVWNPQIGPRGGWMFRVGDLYEFSRTRRRRGDNLRRQGGKPQAG